MARKIVVFNSFAGGELGQLGEWKAPPNSFTASNMLVNRKGELMVRPGLKNISPSGLTSGVVQGFGVSPVPLNNLWFVQGTAVRTFSSAADNLKTSGTALAETPASAMDWKRDGSTVLFTSSADKIYRLTPQGGATNPTVAALTGSPGALAIEVYGDRVVAANIDGSFGYRLRFSDAADPDSWPAANFIDVGDNFHLTGLYGQRQHLLIAKQNGYYVLTGVPGVNPVLRKVFSGHGPLRPLNARMGQHDRLWYQHILAKYPASFNGSIPNEVSHLEYTTAVPNDSGTLPESHGVAPLAGRDTGCVFVSDTGDKALVYLNGVWTQHTFGVSVTGFIAPENDLIHMCDGGSAGAAPKFYTWNVAADTPGIEGSDVMKAGDDSSTALSGSVTFPEWWAQDGAEVRVRHVVVDFRSFNTGSATNNHFDLTVNALRRYQAGSAQASTTVSFDEAASSSSASGTLQRRIFGVGEQGRGNGWQLVFAACKGIAITRIEVVLDHDPIRT